MEHGAGTDNGDKLVLLLRTKVRRLDHYLWIVMGSDGG